MTSDRQGPERQCLACRGRGVRDELVRLVRAPDGTVAVDLRARLPGRGAWVHPQADCLEKAAGKGGLLSRAFREPTVADGLPARVRAAVEVALIDGLTLAAAGGGLIGGQDRLASAIAEGRVAELAVARDASERTLRGLHRAAGDAIEVTVLPLDRASLGDRIGAGSRAAVGVLPISACIHLRRQLQRLRRLG